MASLRKFPGSKNWYACFTLPNGKRVQRSTKLTKRSEAQKLADEWGELAKQRVKARQANKVIAEIYQAAHKESLPDATPRSFIGGWLKRRKGEVAESSYVAYSSRANKFLKWLEDRADQPIGELETRDFVSFRNHLSETVSPGTCNHAIKILRGIFEDARRDKFIAENPAKDCGLLRKGTSPARRPFTVDELKTVLAACEEEWRSMVLFGLYTGQRLSDIAKLRWSNLDLQAGEVQVRTAKTGRVVRVPIAAPLLKHIEGLPAGDEPDAPIHPKAVELTSVNGSTLSRQFGEILASVGLAPKKRHQTPEGEKKGRGARRRSSELSFHSLRHTATSLMKNAGISPAVVQDIIGHDSAEISAHYTHIEHDAKHTAVSSIPDLVD